jgi:cytochrome P450
MRITAPSPGSRLPLSEINLADPELYTRRDAHLVWQTLRAGHPIFWQALPDGRGFWAVTRRADVCRVLAEHKAFTSERGTAIAMLDAPDPAAGLMMQATDPPRHQLFRQKLGPSFMRRSLIAYTESIRSFVAEAIAPSLDGEIWDAADSFARLPMAVAAMLMDLPKTDIDPLLRLAFASLAPLDPKYSAGSGKTTTAFAHYEIIRYFTECIEKRRGFLSDDLISHLITIKLEGRHLTREEILFNCLSLLLGAVVTTSQAISATMIAVAERLGGEGRWRRDLPIKTAVEEALRWSSPVTHFMRRARYDMEIHGEKICEGDAITAWIASANRDEAVFDQPYTLDLERSPNHHMAFGYGPHRCLGSNLARLMLQISFEELIARIEAFEIAGPPRHLVSNEIAGVVSLPLRIRAR